jgi:hypothetical protein
MILQRSSTASTLNLSAEQRYSGIASHIISPQIASLVLTVTVNVTVADDEWMPTTWGKWRSRRRGRITRPPASKGSMKEMMIKSNKRQELSRLSHQPLHSQLTSMPAIAPGSLILVTGASGFIAT